VKRPRDADASRAALLQAAGELFAERGYERATARDIGTRAGVDPAMIARYFGGKAQLYIAVVHAESGADVTSDILDPDRMRDHIMRAAQRGPGPIYQVAVRPHDDPAAQAAARAELHARMVVPLTERLRRDGVDQPEARAELISAAFIGVLLARTSGAFDHLQALGVVELQALLLELLTPPKQGQG
jgi:AcrR family transcriptional regulator